MFNHYHYWPNRLEYRRQEELLEQARLAHLLREAEPNRPGLVVRLASAIAGLMMRVFARRRPASNRTPEFRLQAHSAGRQ